MQLSVLEKMKKVLTLAGVQEGSRILAAVSGGADSVCLLLALSKLGFPVHVVHVEHGIRGQESLEDCAFVRRLCEERQIPLRIVPVDAPARACREGMSLEEAARSLRWDALTQTAEQTGIQVIATAHHRMDQAETVLWNLIRGSSVQGLGGIRPVRREHGLTVVRPLIDCEREQIEAYLRENRVSWCEDSTNADLSLTRNAIRQKVLPLLKELNPGAVRHIAAAASDLQDVEDWLRAGTEQAWDRVILENGNGRETDLTADRGALMKCPGPLRGRILRRMMAQCLEGEKDISRTHIQALETLAAGRSGQELCLPDHLRAVSEEGVLRLTRRKAEKTDLVVPLPADGRYFYPDTGTWVEAAYLTWPGGEVPKKKYTKYLAYDTMAPCPVLRTRREGDYLIVNASSGKKKLKDYLIDEKVPRFQRDSLLLVAQGSHVLWVIGMRISEGAKVQALSKALRVTVSGDTDLSF